MMGYGYGLFGGFGMGIGILVWILIVALAVWALVRFTGGRGGSRLDSAIDILNRRYSDGEISKAEYDQAKRDLS